MYVANRFQVAAYNLASGVTIVVADRETLIRTKRTLRPSDAADRAWLEAAGKDET